MPVSHVIRNFHFGFWGFSSLFFGFPLHSRFRGHGFAVSAWVKQVTRCSSSLSELMSGSPLNTTHMATCHIEKEGHSPQILSSKAHTSLLHHHALHTKRHHRLHDRGMSTRRTCSTVIPPAWQQACGFDISASNTLKGLGAIKHLAHAILLRRARMAS